MANRNSAKARATRTATRGRKATAVQGTATRTPKKGRRRRAGRKPRYMTPAERRAVLRAVEQLQTAEARRLEAQAKVEQEEERFKAASQTLADTLR